MICDSMGYVMWVCKSTLVGRFSALKAIHCAAFISFSSPAPAGRSQGCVHFSLGARPACYMFTLNKSCCPKKPICCWLQLQRICAGFSLKNQLWIFHSKYLLPFFYFPRMFLGCPVLPLFTRCIVSGKMAQHKSHKTEAGRPGRT